MNTDKIKTLSLSVFIRVYPWLPIGASTQERQRLAVGDLHWPSNIGNVFFRVIDAELFEDRCHQVRHFDGLVLYVHAVGI